MSLVDKAAVRRRLIDRLREAVAGPAASGRGWRPTRSRTDRRSTSGSTSTSPTPRTTPGSPGPPAARRLLDPLRQHPRLRRAARGPGRPAARRHPVARPLPRRLSRTRRTGGTSSGPTRSCARLASRPRGSPRPTGAGRRARRALEDLGYGYSSDFQLGYDDLRSSPGGATGSRGSSRSRSTRSARGCSSTPGRPTRRVMADHLVGDGPGARSRRASRRSSTATPSGGWAGSRRSSRRWPRPSGESIALADDAHRVRPVVALADRAGRGRSCPKEDGRFEVQFDEWDAHYPAGPGGRPRAARRGRPAGRPAAGGAPVETWPTQAPRVRADAPAPELVPAVARARRRRSARRSTGRRSRRVDDLPEDGLRESARRSTCATLRATSAERNGGDAARMIRRAGRRLPSSHGPRRPWHRRPLAGAEHGRARCSSARAELRVPGAGRRREPARPDRGISKPWASPSGRSRPGPTGSRTRGCSTCSGCRARGWSWRGWPGRGRVPVVLSPICWFEPRALAALARTGAAAALDLAKWASRRAVPRLPGWRRELLRLADAILPNSRAEADQLVRLFGADRAQDPRRAQRRRSAVRPRRSPDLFREPYGRASSSSTSAGSSRGRMCWA